MMKTIKLAAMEKKNLLLIVNHVNGPQGVQVSNFSDENVKKALSELFGINTQEMQALTADTSGAYYGVTKSYPEVQDKIKSDYFSQGYIFTIRLVYGDLYI